MLEDATFLDIEAGSVDDRWNVPVENYFRLGQWAVGQGEVQITEDYEEIISVIESSSVVISHQGHLFDWSVLYGKDSTRPLELALERRLFDTKTFATYTFPAPETYRRRNGHWQKNASAPANAKRGWLSLDNLAYQFGVPGKEGDLKALAKEFGGFDKIPLDDERYLDYARQDVVTLRDLTSAMLQWATVDDYDWREQTWAAIEAQVTRNGFRVDVAGAKARVEELADRKAELLATLESEYGFPTEGKMPWRTTKGKEAILSLLGDAGVVPEEDPSWEKTKTGNISLGGEALISGSKGTPAEDTARLVAELQGHRSNAEMTLENLQNDGRVHPEIQSLQRSGRSSVTDPGLTVIDSRDKYYYVASEGRKLVSVDYSAADARAVAAMSGDKKYMERFEPGVDPHELTGVASFGEETYYSNPTLYRNGAKPISHSSNYATGAKTIQRLVKKFSGMDITIAEAQQMLDNYFGVYSDVKTWMDRVGREGTSGWVTNLWGRRLPVDPKRSKTQAPGLLGQGTTREIIVDACIRMLEFDIRLITYIVALVHDEVIFDLPEKNIDKTLADIERLMPGKVNGVVFNVGVGEPADNWQLATH